MLRKRKVETRHDIKKRQGKQQPHRSSSRHRAAPVAHRQHHSAAAGRKRSKPGARFDYASYNVRVHSPQPQQRNAVRRLKQRTAGMLLSESLTSGGASSSSGDYDDFDEDITDNSYEVDTFQSYESDPIEDDLYRQRVDDDEEDLVQRRPVQPNVSPRRAPFPTTPRLSARQLHRIVSPRQQQQQENQQQSSIFRRWGTSLSNRQQQQPWGGATALDGLCCGKILPCSKDEQQQQPGISIAEEQRMWRDALQSSERSMRERRRNRKQTPQRGSFGIDHVEVVPVNPQFQAGGSFAYTEMDGEGMLFAPANMPPTPPQRAPWWEREEWNEFTTTDVVVAKPRASNHGAPSSVANTAQFVHKNSCLDNCFPDNKQTSLLHKAKTPRPRLARDVQSIFRKPHEIRQEQEAQRSHAVAQHQIPGRLYGHDPTTAARTAAADSRHVYNSRHDHLDQQQPHLSASTEPSSRSLGADTTSYSTNSDLDESLDRRVARQDRSRNVSAHPSLQRIRPRSDEMSASERSVDLSIPHLRHHDYTRSTLELRTTNYGNPIVVENIHAADTQKMTCSNTSSESDLSLVVKKKYGSDKLLGETSNNESSEESECGPRMFEDARVARRAISNEPITSAAPEPRVRIRDRYDPYQRDSLPSRTTNGGVSDDPIGIDNVRSDDGRSQRRATSASPIRLIEDSPRSFLFVDLSSENDSTFVDKAKDVLPRQHTTTSLPSYIQTTLSPHRKPLTPTFQQPSHPPRPLSPIRLYGDPPLPRREDGSPLASPKQARPSAVQHSESGMAPIPHNLQGLLACLSPGARAGNTAENGGLVLIQPTINIYPEATTPAKSVEIKDIEKSPKRVTAPQSPNSSMQVIPDRPKDTNAMPFLPTPPQTSPGLPLTRDRRDEKSSFDNKRIGASPGRAIVVAEDEYNHVVQNGATPLDIGKSSLWMRREQDRMSRHESEWKDASLLELGEKRAVHTRNPDQGAEQRRNGVSPPTLILSPATKNDPPSTIIDLSYVVDQEVLLGGASDKTVDHTMKGPSVHAAKTEPIPDVVDTDDGHHNTWNKPTQRGDLLVHEGDLKSREYENKHEELPRHSQGRLSVENDFEGSPNDRRQRQSNLQKRGEDPKGDKESDTRSCSPELEPNLEESAKFEGIPRAVETFSGHQKAWPQHHATLKRQMKDRDGIQSESSSQSSSGNGAAPGEGIARNKVVHSPLATSNSGSPGGSWSSQGENKATSKQNRSRAVIDKDLSWKAVVELKQLYHLSPTQDTDSVLLSKDGAFSLPRIESPEGAPTLPDLHHESVTRMRRLSRRDNAWARSPEMKPAEIPGTAIDRSYRNDVCSTHSPWEASGGSSQGIPSTLDSPKSSDYSSFDFHSVSSTSILDNLFVDPADQSLYSLLLKYERGGGPQDDVENKTSSVDKLHHQKPSKIEEGSGLPMGKWDKTRDRNVYEELIKRGRMSMEQPRQTISAWSLQSHDQQHGGKVTTRCSGTLSPLSSDVRTERNLHCDSPLSFKDDISSLDRSISQATPTTRLDRLRKLQAKLHSQHRDRLRNKRNPKSPKSVTVTARLNGVGTITERLNGARQRAAKSLKRGVVGSVTSRNTSPRAATTLPKPPTKVKPPPIHGLVEVYLQTKGAQNRDQHSPIKSPRHDEPNSFASNAARRPRELVHALPFVAKARNAAAAKPGRCVRQREPSSVT